MTSFSLNYFGPIMIGVALIGVLTCYFGRCVYRPVCALMGGAAGAFIGWKAMEAMREPSLLASVMVIGGLALLLSILAIASMYLDILMLGFATGGLIGAFVMVVVSGPIGIEPGGRIGIVIMLLAGVGGLLLAAKYIEHCLIVMTAVSGAILLLQSLTFLLLNIIAENVIHDSGLMLAFHAIIQAFGWLLIVPLGLFIATGILFQWRQLRRRA